MNSLFMPLGILFDQAGKIKNFMYDRGWSEVSSCGKPVVSVGNLTAGGTGKTPIIASFVQWALDNNLKPAVVSRGYKGQFEGVQRVQYSPQDSNTVYYGDEPTMLAKKFGQVPIYVGGDRIRACKKLIDECEVDIIFADDAFQHRRLKREIDIVVIDLTEAMDSYRPLPWGRLRESISGILRSQYIIFNKVSLAEKGHEEKIKDKIKDIFSTNQISCPQFIDCDYDILKFLSAKEDLDISSLRSKNVILVSAIGRNYNFKKLICGSGPSINVLRHFEYPDHHRYTQKDVEDINNYFYENKADRIITTEKDAVKLNPFSELNENLLVACLDLKWGPEISCVYEDIIKKVR